MPYNSGAEDGFFFVRMEDLCKTSPLTCAPGTSLIEAARLMQEHDETGIVVLEDGRPIGIFSIRDLRRLVVQSAGELAGLAVRDGMTGNIITIRAHDFVFDAILRMVRHNIHRLGVVDSAGNLVGLISDTDLLGLQTRTPLYLTGEIEEAQSIEQLRAISARLIDTIALATKAGADIQGLVQLISHFNDAQTQRLITLLQRDEGISLPAGTAYLALGSEGRREQTLRTDQDSAMVYVDDLPPEAFAQMERFAARLIEGLVSLGVPRCPGDTMASNPQWRHSLSGWEKILDQWMAVPIPDNMVNFGMFQDLRTLHGDQTLERRLQEHILTESTRNSLFLAYVARNIARFTPPLGMFGRFKVERSGENRGKIDLKRAGIFAITRGVSLLALEAGIVDGTTWEKLELLGGRGIISDTDRETVEESFNYLVNLRLQRQLKDLKAGNEPSNHVDPMTMLDKQRDQLRQALNGVGVFLRIIKDRFQLDMISR